jgi:alkanesulfonate monooxygenase SsuD/methylene tetrahydromethanopterin reductase-like flavin-dependent oxidoreductase (luciferase family)
MIFFADGAGIRQGDTPPGSLSRTGRDMVELEPMTLLPALAMVTRHVGLVTTASTTYNEPYNLARKFATLDLISKGRAGWNVVASWSELEAQNFGLETTLDYDTRYARSAEFVEVVKGLWDSWDDGALVFDKAAGGLCNLPMRTRHRRRGPAAKCTELPRYAAPRRSGGRGGRRSIDEICGPPVPRLRSRK